MYRKFSRGSLRAYIRGIFVVNLIHVGIRFLFARRLLSACTEEIRAIALLLWGAGAGLLSSGLVRKGELAVAASVRYCSKSAYLIGFCVPCRK